MLIDWYNRHPDLNAMTDARLRDLGEAIKRNDKAHGWSSKKTAKKSSLNPLTYDKYRQGRRHPPPEVFAKLEKAYSNDVMSAPPPGAGAWSARQEAKEREKVGALSDLVAIYNGYGPSTPLHEHLIRVHAVEQLRPILRALRRSRRVLLRFDSACRNIGPGDDLPRLSAILCRLSLEALESGFEGLESAPVILQRLARPASCSEPGRFRRLIERVESATKNGDGTRVHALEPLCMGAMENQQVGAFVMHVERLIKDPAWRQEDTRVRFRYYGTVDATVENVFRHMGERSIDVQCHDVGTVIELAKNAFLSIDEKQDLCARMQISLKAIGLSAAIIAAFRDQVLLGPESSF
jgi:hypothetical protein